MSNTSIHPTPKATTSPRQAIVLTLAVLLACWYCFPAAVNDWMSDHCTATAFCSGPQGITEAVDGASRSVGVAGTFEAWRDEIRSALGIDFY